MEVFVFGQEKSVYILPSPSPCSQKSLIKM